MTDQVVLPTRVFDDNGNPASGARINFFESGTTTVLTVYTDETLADALGVYVDTDSSGIPPQCFYSGSTAVRVRCDDSSGNVLWERDPMPTSGTGAGASDISFEAITGNSAANVQAAIENNTNNITSLTEENDNASAPVKTAGSSNAYTLAAKNTITAYAEGQVFLVVADRANTGTATLNVDSLGPINWWRYDATGTAVAMVSGDIAAGGVYQVVYDGTRFVTTSPVEASETQPGIVERSTDAEALAGTAIGKIPDVAQAQSMIDKSLVVVAMGSFDGTGTPAWNYRSGFSATITDNGTGDYSLAFDANEADAQYLVFIHVESPGTGINNRLHVTAHTLAVGGFDIRSTSAAGDAFDFDGIHVLVIRKTWA